ncbi:hypothetical protein QGP82_09010 [Leptothoe sp. LEGE 181152]|nr:hypothetical protein [Leptothoe sp. LEGE 181152]
MVRLAEPLVVGKEAFFNWNWAIIWESAAVKANGRGYFLSANRGAAAVSSDATGDVTQGGAKAFSNVESLASYTQRLIEAHSIDFDYFLQYESYPNLGRQKTLFDHFSPKSILNTRLDG